MKLMEIIHRCATEERALNPAFPFVLFDVCVMACVFGTMMHIERSNYDTEQTEDGDAVNENVVKNTISKMVSFRICITNSKALLIWYMHDMKLSNKPISEETSGTENPLQQAFSEFTKN